MINENSIQLFSVHIVLYQHTAHRANTCNDQLRAVGGQIISPYVYPAEATEYSVTYHIWSEHRVHF